MWLLLPAGQLDNAASLGVASGRVIVAGCSAGGILRCGADWFTQPVASIHPFERLQALGVPTALFRVSGIFSQCLI